MKCFHVVVLLGVALAAASPAWAQYGLYGSPDMLPLPPANSVAASQDAYPDESVSPSSSATSAPYAAPVDGVLQPSAYVDRDQVAYAPQPKSQGAPGDAAAAKEPKLKPARPKGPGVVSRMLQESPAYPMTAGCGDCGGAGCGDGGGGMFGGLVGGFGSLVDQARGYVCGDACGDVCGDGCGGYECPPRWWARGSWLIMGRNQANTLWTSFETDNNANQIPSEFGMEWGNGGQITFGRCFDNGQWGLEATYWGLDPLEGSSSVTHANTVSTPLDFSDVVYADPALAGQLPVSLFDGADEHRLTKSDEVHNVELNMVFHPFECGYGCDRCGCSPLAVDWLVGVRYFRFDERWTFHSLRGGGSWANAADVGRLEDDIINNLVGVQFGFDANYCWRHNLRFFLKPKFGIYNNHLEHTFRAYRGDGQNFAPAAGSGVPGAYPVRSTVNAFSFLTEVDLGLEWQFTPRWSAFMGYRVVAATGMGLAENQIPPFVVDIPELAAIDHNGDLVLHGAFAGASFTF